MEGQKQPHTDYLFIIKKANGIVAEAKKKILFEQTQSVIFGKLDISSKVGMLRFIRKMGNKASSKDMLFLLRKNFLHFILMKTYLGFNEFNFSYDNNIGHVHSLPYVI